MPFCKKLLCLFLIFITPPILAVQYEISEGLYNLIDINDNNTILAKKTVNEQLLITPRGEVTLLSPELVDINNNGQKVGSVFLFVSDNQEKYYEEVSGGVAKGITDLGLLFGYVGNQGFSIDTNLGSPAQYYSLIDGGSSKIIAGAVNSNPVDINFPHILVGEAENANGIINAFAWHNGSYVDIGNVSGADYSSATSVNRNGLVVGTGYSTGNYYKAFIYDLNQPNAQLQELPTPALVNNTSFTNYYSSATSVNDSGYVLGQESINFANWRGFITHEGKSVYLNEISADPHRNVAYFPSVINKQNMILAKDLDLQQRIMQPRKTGVVQIGYLDKAYIGGSSEERSVAVYNDLVLYPDPLASPKRLSLRQLNPLKLSEIRQAFPLDQEVTDITSYGQSVAISADTIAIAAPQDGTTGAVYLYQLDEIGNWQFRQRLAPSSLVSGDRFGWDIKIDNDLMVISANPGDAVFTYSQDTNGNWNADANPLSVSGFDLDLKANRLLVASNNQAQLFTRSSNDWGIPIDLTQTQPTNIGGVALTDNADKAYLATSGLYSLLEFAESEQWSEKRILVRNNSNNLTLQNDILVSNAIYKRRYYGWSQITRQLGSGTYIVSSNNVLRVERNRITRYRISDINQPMAEINLDLQHNLSTAVPTGEFSDYDLLINNNSSADLRNVYISHSVTNAQIISDSPLCEIIESNRLHCLIDILPAKSSQTLSLRLLPDQVGDVHLSSFVQIPRDSSIYSASNSIIAYEGQPGLTVISPREGSTITLPPSLNELSVCVNFNSNIFGSVVYKVYLNELFIKDHTSLQCIDLGNLGVGDYTLRIDLYKDGKPLTIDDIPISVVIKFRITKPFINILSPDEIDLDVENGEYYIAFDSDADFTFQKIVYSIGNNGQKEVRSLEPIKINKEELKPGINQLIMTIYNGTNATPTTEPKQIVVNPVNP